MPTDGKPILVATDLSARSDRAIDRAILLARQWGVGVMVVHALQPGSKLAAKPELADQAIRAALPDPQADVTIMPAIGQAPTVIAETAAAAGCGLIVTGVARFNEIGDFLVGTAVEHVVRHATMPVLVVKQRPHTPYNSILVATDYSNCSRQALIVAAKMFPGALLHLVHAYHVPFEGFLRSDEIKQEITEAAQRELNAFLNDLAIPDTVRQRLRPHLSYGSYDDAILHAADTLDVNLLVLGTHGRSGFVASMIGSVAEAILRCAAHDTLMVREQA
jgi:nucleotide-binding universal stress UspA family protein